MWTTIGGPNAELRLKVPLHDEFKVERSKFCDCVTYSDFLTEPSGFRAVGGSLPHQQQIERDWLRLSDITGLKAELEKSAPPGARNFRLFRSALRQARSRSSCISTTSC